MKQALKKLGAFLLTMVIVSFVTFLAFQLIPGDPVTHMLGTSYTPERADALREQLGLKGPLLVRYWDWLKGFITGAMGTSYSYNLPVSQLVGEKVGNTLALNALTFVLIVALSLPIGLFTVRRHGGAADRCLTVVNQVIMAVPPFFTGILFTWLFSVVLSWLPGTFIEFSQDPVGYWKCLFFPALALALPRIAMTVRMLRSTLLEELHRDYVRTAISRGNDSRAALYRHALKNALPPVVTFLAQTMAEIVASSIVVEQVFSIPGLGRLLLASINSSDWPVVQAIVVLLALWVMLAGTVADLINQRIDPRLRLGGAK